MGKWKKCWPRPKYFNFSRTPLPHVMHVFFHSVPAQHLEWNSSHLTVMWCFFQMGISSLFIQCSIHCFISSWKRNTHSTGQNAYQTNLNEKSICYGRTIHFQRYQKYWKNWAFAWHLHGKCPLTSKLLKLLFSCSLDDIKMLPEKPIGSKIRIDQNWDIFPYQVRSH